MASEGAAVRARAAEAVFEVVYGGASLDAVLAARAAGVDENDRALFRELAFGSLRWYWRCKGVVDQLLQRRPRKADRIVEAVMIVGIYQLEHMRLPAHAAIHATVEACALLDRPALKGLANGVLRNFQRRAPELIGALPAPARDAHPEWLWRAIVEQWPAQAPAIIASNNIRPPMTLRVNRRRLAVPEYLQALRAAGIAGRPLAALPAAVVLDRPVNVDSLPGFSDGRVSVQDASAQLLALLVHPAPGQRVLDACAAPGGKLTHMLEAYPGPEFQAVELDPGRARRITENLERLGLEAEVVVADAAEPCQWWDGRPFDLVVLDVPCSGSGVIRRHPDIKVLRRSSDIDGFARSQSRLLHRLWQTVRPGGRLVYATCSILARENQEQVDAFLAGAPDCREERVDLPLGMPLETGWQVLPERVGGDGFYYAVLRKDPGDAPAPGTDGS